MAEGGDMRKKLLVKSMPPLPNKIDMTTRSNKGGPHRKNYSPLSWNEFFDKKESVELDDGSKFNVYIKGTTGPALFLLHGGGYSGLTWACFARHIVTLMDCQVFAVDLRGHGETVTKDEYDLSADSQSQDVENVISKLFGENPPPIFLMGHSMGGAIAVHVAYRNAISSLIGLAVIDVVEGSAMEALQSMQNVLRNRPDKFKSIENAVEWCIRSGQVRNLESARISMPSQITKCIPSASDADCTAAIDEMAEVEEESTIEEVDNNVPFKKPDSSCKSSSKTTENYVWRINLAKTEQFWSGWFLNLSKKFLDVSVPKLLILAGVDRLDKDLTVGQMQGKFQMIVLPKVGHAVHEDSPERVAETVASFFIRNKFASAKNEFSPVFPGC